MMRLVYNLYIGAQVTKETRSPALPAGTPREARPHCRRPKSQADGEAIMAKAVKQVRTMKKAAVTLSAKAAPAAAAAKKGVAVKAAPRARAKAMAAVKPAGARIKTRNLNRHKTI